MKFLRTFLILGIAVFIFSCKKDNAVTKDQAPGTGSGDLYNLSGKAQKGPFTVGSSITVFELDNHFYQTGRSFFSPINDNTGSFELNNIKLTSNNVLIRADGFYYNEVCGSNSISQISLNCISDVSNASTLNVNLMTHLEKPRVEYLLSTGLSFVTAKVQAQAEIMNIFSLSVSGMPPSENLNISQAGDTNAVLLAISSILQGFRKEGELSSLLATISNDIKTDGVLNDSVIKSSLIDQAILLDTVGIRNNLSVFYSSVGVAFSIPDFEKYIRQFIVSTNYTPSYAAISYPQTGLYGANLLDKAQLNYFQSQITASLAGVAKKCCSMKFRIVTVSGFGIGYMQGTGPNINITGTTHNRTYSVINPEFPFDHTMSLSTGTYLIEYYENNMTTPRYSKTITIN